MNEHKLLTAPLFPIVSAFSYIISMASGISAVAAIYLTDLKSDENPIERLS